MPRPDPGLLRPERYQFKSNVTTRYADLDPNGHVNNLAILMVIEEGRVSMYDAMGRTIASSLVVVSLTCEFLAEARHGSEIMVHSGIKAVNRSSWIAEQMAFQDDRAIAYSTATMVMMQDGKVSLSQDWRERLERARTAETSTPGSD